MGAETRASRRLGSDASQEGEAGGSAPLRRVYLVRHGETLYAGRNEGAPPGTDLTERGFRQMEALAALLRPIGIDAIYASPLDRAQASARTLAGSSSPPVVTVEALREIVPGDVTRMEIGQIFAAVRAFFGDPATHWDTPYLGGETYRQLRERVGSFFEALIGDRAWRRVVVVAHGGVNNALIGRIMGLGGPRLANVEQDFGCVNIVDVAGGGPIVRLLNFTAYDPLKATLERSSLDVLRDVLETGFGTPLG
jgi:broad specificity phosphatase PhoE